MLKFVAWSGWLLKLEHTKHGRFWYERTDRRQGINRRLVGESAHSPPHITVQVGHFAQSPKSIGLDGRWSHNAVDSYDNRRQYHSSIAENNHPKRPIAWFNNAGQSDKRTCACSTYCRSTATTSADVDAVAFSTTTTNSLAQYVQLHAARCVQTKRNQPKQTNRRSGASD